MHFLYVVYCEIILHATTSWYNMHVKKHRQWIRSCKCLRLKTWNINWGNLIVVDYQDLILKVNKCKILWQIQNKVIHHICYYFVTTCHKANQKAWNEHKVLIKAKGHFKKEICERTRNKKNLQKHKNKNKLNMTMYISSPYDPPKYWPEGSLFGSTPLP